MRPAPNKQFWTRKDCMLPCEMTNLRAAVMLSASAPEPRLQQKNIDKQNEKASVADPDPYFFGPPGSGSGSLVRGTDPDPSIIKQK
jgi:hypothetical protein